jgi:hypothetical protein
MLLGIKTKPMKNHCDFEFDNQFLKIEGIKYLPWIGKQALEKNQRLLIIGESVYNWGKEDDERKAAQIRLEKNDFARVVAYEHGIDNPNPKRIFARNIERTLADDFENKNDRINFWESILFHELVQRPLAHKKVRPTKSDYDNGSKVLTSIMQITKPNKCVFLGTTWAKFAGLKNSLELNYTIEEKHFGKINGANPKTILIKELNTKVYFIKHPSSFFSPELWKDFIEKN